MGVVDWTNLSHALLPTAVRRRAVEMHLEPDRDVYPAGDPVGFRVVFRNRLPVPVVLRVESPVPWSWSVDGIDRGSRVADPLPDDSSRFEFAPRERKAFAREWHQRIRTGRREWDAVAPGDHVLRAWVTDRDRSLAAEATVHVDG
ncbi:hypothetical protein ACFQJD_14105 [Haloplanus sp. GCM10025708]|uniref:hypothetical protein n=1 Tax=Haloferacaceae TaxID=1644056 RepID=UPI00361A1B2B